MAKITQVDQGKAKDGEQRPKLLESPWKALDASATSREVVRPPLRSFLPSDDPTDRPGSWNDWLLGIWIWRLKLRSLMTDVFVFFLHIPSGGNSTDFSLEDRRSKIDRRRSRPGDIVYAHYASGKAPIARVNERDRCTRPLQGRPKREAKQFLRNG